MDDTKFKTLINRLKTYRMLRHDPHENHYTTHPLIRSHYFAILSKQGIRKTKQIHEQIKEYYLSVAGDVLEHPTLDDLVPLIEAVHHACQAGTYDEAHRIRRDRISQGRSVLIYELGAYETSLALMIEFFPDGDTSQEPLVSNLKDRSWILNAVGIRLMNLGRLSEVVPFYERTIKIKMDITKDWKNASVNYQNLAGLYFNLGRLAESARAAAEGLQLARRADDKSGERKSLGYQAWVAHLRGDDVTAGKIFQRVETIEREIDPNINYIYSIGGVMHADHLRRVGNADIARRVTEANLKICEEAHWADDICRCHRVLGDLASDAGDHENAHHHYEAALKIARSISHQAVLIEALLGRGLWLARKPSQPSEGSEPSEGYADLNEALDYALQGGYRIYEADIRVALAWAHLVSGNLAAAKTEA